ncbi:hypothetical protein ACEN4E_01905 [Latilactobacillus sakei]|uniref:hypothetical protein n=1 Tax=Latilactobacillus sakei TaxID=1599 RepID=UPI0038875753
MKKQKFKRVKYFIRDFILLVCNIGILSIVPIVVFRFISLKSLMKILDDNDFGWLNLMLTAHSKLGYIIVRVLVVLIFWKILFKGFTEILKKIQPISSDKHFYVKDIWKIEFDRFITKSNLFNPVNKSIGVQFYVWLHEERFSIDPSWENGVDLPEKTRKLCVRKDFKQMERLNRNLNLLLGDTYCIYNNQLPLSVLQNDYILINRIRLQTEEHIRERDINFLNEITKLLKETTDMQNYDVINIFANINPYHLKRIVQNNFTFAGRNTERNHNFKRIQIFQYDPKIDKFCEQKVVVNL